MEHLVIPDTQVRPGLKKSQLKHLDALACYINTHVPDKVIMLGDWWDMPSLCRYDVVGSKKTEGRRIQKDIDAGNRAMDNFVESLEYQPEMHFLMGNHEDRLLKLGKEDPRFEGVFDNAFNLDAWYVHDFLTPVELDGIYYCHYFVAQYTGRALGGNALSQLKQLGFSFTAGHKQILDISRIDRNNKTSVQGLVAGAFYQHDEEYKGEQGNNHARCIVHKKMVKNGTYDLEVVSIERLLKEYL